MRRDENQPKPLSPEQEARLQSALSGELKLDDDRLQETVDDARSLREEIARLGEQANKAKALAASIGIEIVRKEGAFDKCITDLKRWDPVLSGKTNGVDENPEPQEPSTAPPPEAT